MNETFGWLWVALGLLSGTILGLRFQREDWLGGYASHRRRLVRLGHISLFGLGFLNILFAHTLGRIRLDLQERKFRPERRSIRAWCYQPGCQRPSFEHEWGRGFQLQLY